MTELSLCMIVKNEEERLARCLSSVQGAVDEIIILDTGSTDGTKDVALRFTQRVYDYAWDDDFSAARNASFAYATRPFILWLDADDVMERSEPGKAHGAQSPSDRRCGCGDDEIPCGHRAGWAAVADL